MHKRIYTYILFSDNLQNSSQNNNNTNDCLENYMQKYRFEKMTYTTAFK